MSKNVPITAPTPLPAPAPTHAELGPLVGKRFGGCSIVGYIGEGPTGSVYRAQGGIGTAIAVKIMHRELSRREHADRLWRELQTLNQLDSEHFLRVHERGFGPDGEFFYTMDEPSGVDLEAALEESGAFAPKRALEILDQVCEALTLAHAAGVVHGGLKPRNVFLVPSGGRLVVKVLDFGAARLAGGVDKGVIVGNPFYMAPEQFGGQSDERTDVYSLGVLMYELFSGTLPFNGPTYGQVMMRHLAEMPSSPPGVDDTLAAIILKALNKTPTGRFQSVRALHRVLTKWAGEARALEDAAAVQVIARAAAARRVKQAALTTPDQTAPTGKIDVTELQHATRQTMEPHGTTDKRPPTGSANGMNTTTRKDDNPNSPESVEASLEDFISKANATFPTADGGGPGAWDLHTGDVELVDDTGEKRLEEEEHVSAPIKVAPKAQAQAKPAAPKTPAPSPSIVQPVASKPKAETAAQLIKKADQSVRRKKALNPSVEEPTPLPPPTAVAAAKPKRNPFEVPVTIVDEEPAPLDPPPTGPKRKLGGESTEVVSSPLPRMVPWTSNPMIWIAGVFAAFISGAVLVFAMVRTMMPSQPVVMQAPAVVQRPAAQLPAPSQPVVTPLDQPAAAAQPRAVVVTSLAPAATPVKAAKVEEKPAVHKAAAPAPVHKAVAAPARPAAKLAAASKKKAAADDDDDDDAGAAKKPAAKGKKAPAKGGDWVDPFAQ